MLHSIEKTTIYTGYTSQRQSVTSATVTLGYTRNDIAT